MQNYTHIYYQISPIIRISDKVTERLPLNKNKFARRANEMNTQYYAYLYSKPERDGYII